MSQVIVWLVRHGETIWNAQHKISGWVDVELSQRGQEMARDLAWLTRAESFDGVWSSDLQRAIETARLSTGLSPSQDRRLRELDFGPLEGQDWRAIPEGLQQGVLDFSEDCTCGGEKISDFEERVCGFLNELPPGRHLVYVHAGVIRIALRKVKADRYVTPASVAVVDWSNKKLIDLHAGPAGAQG